ncbi:hypothetical protein [Marinobacter sp. CP1]|jgi:hypothetical protein|uniref:hypothetical protein n=1 Tax=Marinobacter sp. CP1 TaxID=1671721 RepID=UPI000A73D2CC|nr:hypothetical protein [Marinobacter sp. CP1]
MSGNGGNPHSLRDLLGTYEKSGLDTVDVNVERLAGATMKEIKYVMGVSNVYE